MNEAKDKAKYLVDKFQKHVHECNNSDAKQCALICVDEIIKDRLKLLEEIYDADYAYANSPHYCKELYEIKKEIESL